MVTNELFRQCLSAIPQEQRAEFDLSYGIAERLDAVLKKKGITQEALASALSVSPQAVSKWESGLTYPDMSMIPIIAGYFEVSLDTLFDYDLKELMTISICRVILRNTSK